MLDYCLKTILKTQGNTIIIYDENLPCFRIDEYDYTEKILNIIELYYIIINYLPYLLVMMFELIYIYSFYLIDLRRIMH